LERILIIGGNGCGKTTLAQTLASKLELPLIHLDMLNNESTVNKIILKNRRQVNMFLLTLLF